MSKVKFMLDAPINLEAVLQSTKTGFTMTDDGKGIIFSWSDDPLDFLWQNYTQAFDLAEKLIAILGRERDG